MKDMLLAEVQQGIQVTQSAAPPFRVAGEVYNTAVVPVANSAGQVPSAATSVSNDAVANSILGSTMTGYFEMMGYLLLILAGVWLLLCLLRRGGVGLFSPERQVMAVESRLALGPKKWMIVARVHGRRLVLGVTDHTVSMLAELSDDDVAPSPQGLLSQKTSKTAKKLLGKVASVQKKSPSPQKKSSREISGQSLGSGKNQLADDFEKSYEAAQAHEKKTP